MHLLHLQVQIILNDVHYSLIYDSCASHDSYHFLTHMLHSKIYPTGVRCALQSFVLYHSQQAWNYNLLMFLACPQP